MNKNRKLTVSLPENVINYADRYRLEHDLPSRSEVLVLALNRLREQELAKGYKAMAEASLETTDAWLDSGITETLTEIDKTH